MTGAAGIRNETARLRNALDRQERASTSEAWLADETTAQAARDRLAAFGCDVPAIEAGIRMELAGLKDRRKRGRPAGVPAKPLSVFPLPGLTAARKRAGDSSRAMGALIGVNASHARKIELGEVRLDLERAFILSRHYGLELESFPVEPRARSTWYTEAAHVLDVMDESAARVPGERGALASYHSESGLIVATALRSPFRLQYHLNGEPIARHEAQRLIAERMQSRLS